MADESEDRSILALLARIEGAARASLVAVGQLRTAFGLPGSDGAGIAPATASGEFSRDTNGGAPGNIRQDEFFRQSIPEGIVKYLSIVKKPSAPRDIVSGLQRGGMLSNAKNFASNVWTAIGRLKDAGVVVNTTTGWGLAEWYPGRPPKAPPDAPKKKSAKAKKAAKAKHAKPVKPVKPIKPAAKVQEAQEPEKSDAAALTFNQFKSRYKGSGKSMEAIGKEWQDYKKAP